MAEVAVVGLVDHRALDRPLLSSVQRLRILGRELQEKRSQRFHLSGRQLRRGRTRPRSWILEMLEHPLSGTLSDRHQLRTERVVAGVARRAGLLAVIAD